MEFETLQVFGVRCDEAGITIGPCTI